MAYYFIDINTPTSYGAVALVRLILSAPGVQVKKARINTNGQIPSADVDPSEWALILECTSDIGEAREFDIRICMLTTGYSGSGPMDMLRCLKLAGFKSINEDEIFTVHALHREYVK